MGVFIFLWLHLTRQSEDAEDPLISGVISAQGSWSHVEGLEVNSFGSDVNTSSPEMNPLRIYLVWHCRAILSSLLWHTGLEPNDKGVPSFDTKVGKIYAQVAIKKDISSSIMCLLVSDTNLQFRCARYVYISDIFS